MLPVSAHCVSTAGIAEARADVKRLALLLFKYNLMLIALFLHQCLVVLNFIILQDSYCRNIGVEYMFINNFEQCDWIRRQFEPPGITTLENSEKLLAWERLLRSTKYSMLVNWKIKILSQFKRTRDCLCFLHKNAFGERINIFAEIL